MKINTQDRMKNFINLDKCKEHQKLLPVERGEQFVGSTVKDSNIKDKYEFEDVIVKEVGQNIQEMKGGSWKYLIVNRTNKKWRICISLPN